MPITDLTPSAEATGGGVIHRRQIHLKTKFAVPFRAEVMNMYSWGEDMTLVVISAYV